MKLKHDPIEWMLFLDSSKLSLEGVLLHNGNRRLSILGYVVLIKATYPNMSTFLNLIKYIEHQWKFCGDLNIITLILEMQLWYTIYFHSRDKKSHYITFLPRKLSFWILNAKVKKACLRGYKYVNSYRILRSTLFWKGEKAGAFLREDKPRFLGIKRGNNYTQLFAVVLQKYLQLECNMYQKFILYSDLDFS